MRQQSSPSAQSGFSLMEAVVALSVLSIGLLGLAQVFVLGLNQLSTSSSNLIAREKAREAVESVHTARDTRTITWARIRNETVVNDDDENWGECNSVGGGVFSNGAHTLTASGDDGLINTDDDGEVEKVSTPGEDGILGTEDDFSIALENFTREVQICDINNDLREIRVTIRYFVGQINREYRLRTFISAFS